MSAQQNNPNQPEAAQRDIAIGSGYPHFQIAKALTTAQHHPDEKTRVRAEKKAAKWAEVLSKMADGLLVVGDRIPLPNTPAWVTLEVITGGFVTGELLAGGDLREYERDLLQEIAPAATTAALEAQRLLLNRFFVSDAGIARLQTWLQSGTYFIEVPEEGALLAVAWLLNNQQTDLARSLLETLAPWFGKLRFYPAVRSQPQQTSAQVCVQTVGEVSSKLQNISPNRQTLAQKESIEVWIPLYDQMVSLFLETVEGEVPTLQTNENGQWSRSSTGRFPVVGGWPCQQYPENWRMKARAILEAFAREQRQHSLCRKPNKRKEALAQLYDYLKRCIHNGSDTLSGRDVGRIRLLLARYVSKRGIPTSKSCQQLRKRQRRQSEAPTFREISRVLIERLSAYSSETGLSQPEHALFPITADESRKWTVPADTSIPQALQKKVKKSQQASIEELVERGLITSGEVLARVLPQITADIEAVGIEDPSLRRLYAAIYRAFRQRRSLLLLNLQKQVQLEELPWVAAIAQQKRKSLSTQTIAKEALQNIAALTLTAFPQAIIPNKLLQEMTALAKTADLDLPLTEEIAADIFMGRFSGKFIDATIKAAELLSDSLYDRYYDINYRQIRAVLETERAPTSNSIFGRKKKYKERTTAFDQLCQARAGVSKTGYHPSANGMVLEQQQILSTHNLAVLCSLPGVKTQLENRFEELAQRCFIWVCQKLQVEVDDWHAKLIQIKQSAYAWRQMLFFLAQLTVIERTAFVDWANEHFFRQSIDFQQRFRPAMMGLVQTINGQTIDESSMRPLEARRFLGWSTVQHWILTLDC